MKLARSVFGTLERTAESRVQGGPNGTEVVERASTGRRCFEAEPGDVVYVPRQTWHLASFGGSEGLRSCRLAMNGFPYQAHMFEAD